MKNLFFVLVLVSLNACADEVSFNWQNPLLNRTITVSSASSNSTGTCMYNGSSAAYKTCLTSRHICSKMTGGNFSGCGSRLFSYSTKSASSDRSEPVVSYTDGVFKTTYRKIEPYPVCYDPLEFYGGDAPGIIPGTENKDLDNPIVQYYAEIGDIYCLLLFAFLWSIFLYKRNIVILQR